MVKLIGVPPHAPFSVTVIVPVIADPVVFAAALKLAMLPEPLAASPINVLEFVQLTDAPVLTANAPTVISSPGQAVMLAFWVITLSGLIVMSKVSAALVQPSLVAVTLIVPLIAEPVLFAGAVKMMSPVPLAAMPIAVLVFVQLNTEPDTLLDNGILTELDGQKL